MKTRNILYNKLRVIKRLHNVLSMYSMYDITLYYSKGILVTESGTHPLYIRYVSADGETAILGDEFGFYAGKIQLYLMSNVLLEKVIWCMEDIVLEMDNNLSKIHTN